MVADPVKLKEPGVADLEGLNDPTLFVSLAWALAPKLKPDPRLFTDPTLPNTDAGSALVAETPAPMPNWKAGFGCAVADPLVAPAKLFGVVLPEPLNGLAVVVVSVPRTLKTGLVRAPKLNFVLALAATGAG